MQEAFLVWVFAKVSLCPYFLMSVGFSFGNGTIEVNSVFWERFIQAEKLQKEQRGVSHTLGTASYKIKTRIKTKSLGRGGCL